MPKAFNADLCEAKVPASNGRKTVDMTPQEKATIQVTIAVGQAIKELGSVPSGHIYAQLMGHMSLESYNNVILSLKNAGLVKEENHLLSYIEKA